MKLTSFIVGSTVLLSLLSHSAIAVPHSGNPEGYGRREESPQASEKIDARTALSFQTDRLREKGGIMIMHTIGSKELTLNEDKKENILSAEKAALMEDYLEAAEIYLNLFGEDPGNVGPGWQLKQKIALLRSELRKNYTGPMHALGISVGDLRANGIYFWHTIGSKEVILRDENLDKVSAAKKVILLQKYLVAAEKYLKLYGEDPGNTDSGWELKQKMMLARTKLRKLTE